MYKLMPLGKKAFVYFIAIVIVASSQSFMAKPASARVDKTFSAPIDLGSQIKSVAIYDASFGKEDGRDVMYTTVSGSPAIFQVVDLVSKEVLREFPLTSASSWSHLTLPDGTVYIGGNGTLSTYSPVTKQLTNLGGIGEQVVYGLSADEQGRIYFGSYPNAKVGRYDPATGEMRDYGEMAPGQSYSRATAYHDGFLYAGIGIEGSLVKLNVETGEKEQIALPTYGGAVQLAQVYQLDTAGKYIVAGLGGGNNALLFYDTEAGEWSETYFLNNKGIRLSYGESSSNKVYFAQNTHLMELDLTTMLATDTGVIYGTFLRNTAWVEMPDDADLPGASLATVTFGGAVAYMNLETKIVKSIQYPVSGNPIPIQSLEKGPDGKLYLGGYPGGKAAVFSPETETTETFGMGQIEGMGSLGNKLYMGVYTGAVIHELDVTQPLADSINPKVVYDIPHQDRPFKITSGEGKLFIGTIPDYGELGGSLTVYDPNDGAGIQVYEDVVHNQAIVGLAVREGKLYGSTTVAGGLGIDPTETAAKVFVWDIATGEKLEEFVPSIPGATAQPQMISGLSFGTDGLLWAAAGGSIFAMDPMTMNVVKSKNIYPSVAQYGRWRPIYIRWSSDGLIYTTLAGKITVIDPSSLDNPVTLASTELMTLGDDGHIYYVDGTSLKKIEVTKGTGEIGVKINLPLLNGSFDALNTDSEIPGWHSLFSITPHVSLGTSQEQFVSSPNSLKLTDKSSTETVAAATDSLPVMPGTEYTASFDVYLAEGRTLASLHYYDANDKLVGGSSLQITTGAKRWQSLEMKAVAPENAVYVRIVLFCSQLWTTTAYYDNVSVSYELRITPADLLAKIEQLEQQGEISHSLSVQLVNAIKQAIHQKEGERQEQAFKHLEDALKHLDKSKSSEITEDTSMFIEQVIDAIIQDWKQI